MFDNAREVFIEERIMVYLMALKITPNLKGYTYFKEGTKKIIEDFSKKYKVNTRLYVELGNEYNVKPVLIDRALRHAIEVCEKRDGLRDFERIAKYEFDDDKISPRKLLCILAEKVNIESYKMLNKKEEYSIKWKEQLENLY